VFQKRSSRIERLRQEYLDSQPTVGLERARIVTRVYRENLAQPILIKRARALEAVLKELTLFIIEGDLLVGNQGEAPRYPQTYPENFVAWMGDEIEMRKMQTRTVNPLRIPKGLWTEIAEIADFWRGDTLVEKCYAEFPPEVLHARNASLFSVSLEKNAQGHCVLDYPLLLEKGYRGIKQEAVQKLADFDSAEGASEGQKQFWQAAVIICDAVEHFAGRYAQLADKQAETAPSSERKAELLEIARICRKVPAGPAESFHEALQSIWLAHLVNCLESNAYSMSFGRLDQYLLPYLENDLDQGRITQDWAQELLNCFWCKTNDLIHLDDSEMVFFHGGHPMGQHVTVGGLTRDGKDATNRLSYMCLEAHATVQMAQPDFSVRFHPDSPKDFQVRTAEVISLGLGLPQIFNDDVIIQALTNDGLPLEEARDYTPTGCVENSTPNCWIRAPGGWMNLPKVLEMTLHEGKCALSGVQIGPRTKPVVEIASFEELMEIFRSHFAYAVKLHVEWSNLIDLVHAQVMPQPSVSLFINDCMETGRDVTQGGAQYNFTSPLMVGIATLADSLAAIKKLVFDDARISMAELMDALEADFTGQEILRAKLINKAPKYGNDLEYVDSMAQEISVLFCDEFAKYKNTRGGKFRAGFWSVTANYGLGNNTAATPDGRAARAPLSDSITPNSGMDLTGITASLKSAAKLDQGRASNGTVLNRHVTPSELQGMDQLNKFLDMVNGYFELGGSNLGFNVISSDTLRDAQLNPEKYSGLMVKVAGYAALFTELGEPCQNELIRRTEHQL
jgi:pyruvate formate-lyase/glycerol dehydratase family glycyl radical enzyme